MPHGDHGNYYTMGHSQATIASHLARTYSSDAAFMQGTIPAHARILDVGCGPGTITVGFSDLVPSGEVVGIDMSDEVLRRAWQTHQEAGSPKNVSFRHGDILAGLDWAPDESFDAVYASQLFPHLPTPEMRGRAISEMRRVLRPGAVLGTRTVAEMHWHPAQLRLDELFTARMKRAFGDDDHFFGKYMPQLYSDAGFHSIDAREAKTECTTPEQRRRLAATYGGRLAEGEATRASWLKVGYSAQDIDATRAALEQWAATDGASYVCVQADVIGRK